MTIPRLHVQNFTWLLVLASLIVSGCSKTGQSPERAISGLPIRPHKQTYTLVHSPTPLRASIVATYTNYGDRPVYLGRCGFSPEPHFVLEKNIGEDWTVAYSPICDMVLAPPFEVQPGEVRTDTLELYDFDSPNMYRYFRVHSIPGTYRIVYKIYDCCPTKKGGSPRLGSLLPKTARVSYNFALAEEQRP